MSSIYKLALGDAFDRLHPKIQQRFGFSSQDRIAAIGRGIMTRVWYGKPYVLPFLYVGTWRNILFPQQGKNVPFTIENYAYLDQFGRETVTWVRKYQFPNKLRHFDATMIYSQERQRVVDYLGTHQHLAVDIDLSVSENGGLHLCSGEQRFYAGSFGFRFPMLFSGNATVTEWYDEHTDQFAISVNVSNRTWGPLFGYEGRFSVEYIPVLQTEDIPTDVLPIRNERRE